MNGVLTRKRDVVSSAVGMVIWGMLFGAGFCLVFHLYQKMQATILVDEAIFEASRYAATGNPNLLIKDGDYSLSDLEEISENGETWIVGKFTNRSLFRMLGIRLQANYFLHGKFVDQASTQIETLPAGKSVLFKISCGCKNNGPATHDSFKVVIDMRY